MEFLEQRIFYVSNICSKFQGQYITTKKVIHNLPICVVRGNHFTTANFDTLPRVENFLFTIKFLSQKLYVNNMRTKFQG